MYYRNITTFYNIITVSIYVNNLYFMIINIVNNNVIDNIDYDDSIIILF